jgi:predicted nucleic acid-binding protein
MKYLIDTGILLRLFDASDPSCQAIRTALKKLRTSGDDLYVTAQNAAEFWNVSTRPSSARGGYGHSAEVTHSRLAFVERLGTVLTESVASYATWRKLVIDLPITGVAVHDTRLVSVMLEASITRILTLNTGDFARYDFIEALTPDEVLST